LELKKLTIDKRGGMETVKVVPGEIQVLKIDSPIFRRVRKKIFQGTRHMAEFPVVPGILPGPTVFYSLNLGSFLEVYVEKSSEGTRNRQLVCWREVIFNITPPTA